MRRLLFVLMLVVAAAGPPPVAAAGGVDDLRVVAHLDLGEPGRNGDIALAGSTAVVGTAPCAPGPLWVVDLADPRRPAVLTTTPLPSEASAADVDARGHLAAIALDHCANGGVVLYDLASPAEPVLLARYGPQIRSVSLANRRDGTVLAVTAGTEGIRVADLSDGRNPSTAAVFTSPWRGTCREAQAYDDGERALALCREVLYDLDLASPSSPVVAGEAPVSQHAEHAVAVLVGDRTLALVSEHDSLHVLDLGASEERRQVGRVRAGGDVAPGRPAASGELAFVPWHGEGLRAVDLAAGACPWWRGSSHRSTSPTWSVWPCSPTTWPSPTPTPACGSSSGRSRASRSRTSMTSGSSWLPLGLPACSGSSSYPPWYGAWRPPVRRRPRPGGRPLAQAAGASPGTPETAGMVELWAQKG